MNVYECMVVLRAAYPIDDEKGMRALVENMTGGAAIKTFTILGKKPLAYPIKKRGVAGKQTEGIYVLATLESPTGIQVADLEKEVRMGTDVLRYLLTVKKEGKAKS